MSKHLFYLLGFEVAAMLPIILIIYWVQKFSGGFTWQSGNFSKFNYHPLFMIIGFVFLMGHSVISFRILPLAHRVKKYIHAGLNTVALIFVISGLVAVFEYHAEHKFAHLYSVHSWLGIVTVSIFFLQLLGGLSIFQDLVKGASDDIRAGYKPYHVAAGVMLVSMVTATICSGIQEEYMFKNPDKWSSHAYLLRFLALSVIMWMITVVFILLTLEKRSPTNVYEELPNERSSIHSS